MSAHHMHGVAQGGQRRESDVLELGSHGCGPPGRCWEPSSCPLQEDPAVLIAESALTLASWFWNMQSNNELVKTRDVVICGAISDPSSFLGSLTSGSLDLVNHAWQQRIH